MWPNPQFPADLVTFTEDILNGKLHFSAVHAWSVDTFKRFRYAQWYDPYIVIKVIAFSIIVLSENTCLVVDRPSCYAACNLKIASFIRFHGLLIKIRVIIFLIMDKITIFPGIKWY